MEPSTSKNMEWMYKPASLVNREDYLLGRAVDKTFDLLESVEQTGTFNYADEVEKDLTPISIFAPTRSGPIDVINKIKEDPLYQIQKKEEENLKQLLKNPVRMKQMRQIGEQLERQRRLSESSSYKSKHQKKHKKRDSSSSSTSSNSSEDAKLNLNKVKSFKDIDKLISEKLKSLKKQASDSSDEDDRKHNSKKHHHSHHGKHYNRKRESLHHSRAERRRSRSRSRDRGHKIDSAPSPSTSRTSFRAPPVTKPNRTPLDETELEKRRQEMMSNAKWRDEQRTKNVTKYREEAKKEEEQHKSKHDPDFIRKQLIEAANTGSVEKRIKSNSYNIQKSSSAMNQNFAKR